jgi:ABC-2 type transport system permease protein
MKVIHIIKREYLEHVRKKSFIISTVLAPLFLGLFYAIPLLSVFFVPNERVSIAVLDRTGVLADKFVASLDDTLKDGSARYDVRVYGKGDGDLDARKESLVAAITNDALDALIEFPDSVLEKGEVNYISKDAFNERMMDDFRDGLGPVVVGQRLADRGLDFAEVAKMTDRIRLNENKITKSGLLEEDQLVGQLVMVWVFVMILYVTLLTWGMAVQRSVIEEKSSRVIEVMLSSVEPRDLFFGKILGLGSVGLTQVAVWSALMLVVGLSSIAATASYMEFVHVKASHVLYFLAFFILGFMLYSSIFTIIGAACNTEQEAQQLQMLVILPLVIPMMLVFLVYQNPNATLSVVLSFVPFFTPMLMLMRVVLADTPAWQVLLSMVLLIATIYGVTLFSARVFRVGILMYGKRPNLREIIRWSQYS